MIGNAIRFTSSVTGSASRIRSTTGRDLVNELPKSGVARLTAPGISPTPACGNGRASKIAASRARASTAARYVSITRPPSRSTSAHSGRDRSISALPSFSKSTSPRRPIASRLPTARRYAASACSISADDATYAARRCA
jgi:hypothetical protein